MLSALIDRIPPLTPARAYGWKVVQLPSVVYPGLVAAPSVVTGVTISHLTDSEWRVLDAFEDPIYELELIELVGGSSAWAYTCPDNAPRTDAPWDAQKFAAVHLSDYVDRCTAWRQRYESRSVR